MTPPPPIHTRPGSPAAIAGLTLLRVAAGVIMTVHGWLKLRGFEGWKQTVVELGIPLPDVAAPLAVAGELAGGLGLLLGLLTPIAAFGVVATMIVAILGVHLPHGLLAKNNGFEYPLTLLCVALFFMLRGPGPISLDAMWARVARSRPRDVEPGAHAHPGHVQAKQHG